MFGVWGSRTIDGSLYTMRNLDWHKDTGIAMNKLITVYHPNDGKNVHATLGFAGMIGALTGMSSKGLTVHESSLGMDELSFRGFPWVLRLRYIMENAENLEEAIALWKETNNTIGMNHMIGSASDVNALVMETMKDYTAYFYSDDPREATATYNNSGVEEQIGFPLKEAVYRTNHPYDPIMRKYYWWPQYPSSWSMTRYMFFYHGFNYYESAQIKMDYADAINMTAILGDKGTHAYHCLANNTDGTNVLSVTFHPSTNELWAAWEDGTGGTWRPGTCNTYVYFDMNEWFSKE